MTLPNYMRNAGGNFPGSFVQFDVPAYLAALKSLDGKPVLDASGNPTGATFDSSASQPVFVPTDSYHVREKTATLYGQFEVSGEMKVKHNLPVYLQALEAFAAAAPKKPSTDQETNESFFFRAASTVKSIESGLMTFLSAIAA